MSRLRHIGPRALLRAVVLSTITLLAADYLLGRRRDQVCDWLDGVPGVSCPGIAEPANGAAVFVCFAALIMAAGLFLVQRPVRQSWIASVTNPTEAVAVPSLWRFITFLQWVVLMGAIAVIQGLASDRYDLLKRDEIGGGSVFVTAALVLGSAGLWTSWREHRTYAWATRVHGVPFLPAVWKGEWDAYSASLHKVWVRLARSSDYGSAREAVEREYEAWYFVECDVCGRSDGYFEKEFEANQAAEQHRRDTAP